MTLLPDERREKSLSNTCKDPLMNKVMAYTYLVFQIYILQKYVVIYHTLVSKKVCNFFL